MSADGRRLHRPSRPLSLWPQRGKRIELYVGKPFSLAHKVQLFKEKHPHIDLGSTWKSSPETIQLYTELASDIETALVELEHEAYGRRHPASPPQI